MTSLRITLLLLFALSLSACTVTYEPGKTPSVTATTPTQTDTQNGAQRSANAYTLRAYPNATPLKRVEKEGKLELEFSTSDPLTSVYKHFHQQLTQQGWRRAELKQKGAATKLEARYLKSGEGLKLKLDQKGRSGRYKLEVKAN